MNLDNPEEVAFNLGRALGLLHRLEWSGSRQGPGTSMSANNGSWYPSCPYCDGLKPGTGAEGDFIAEAIGHSKKCELNKLLEDTIRSKK